MRLLHTKKPGLEFESFYGDIPKYAILSHTWYNDNQEVSYQDVRDGKGHGRLGYEKILKCKALALADDYDYFWVDTCCIDKTSSAELSEAINSMYSWYEKAAVCYAYLSDVPNPGTVEEIIESFMDSRWFTRGWTLQELIAPSIVILFSASWDEMFKKGDEEVVDVLNGITGIPEEVLLGEAELVEVSVAEKMSWASNRVTTRVEDEAYSLMGIFGVNMPLLYGEKEKAFWRLQEEIMKLTDDQSLFAWVDPDIIANQLTGLLAKRAKLFAKSKGIQSMGLWGKGNVQGVTNRGIRAKFFLVPLSADDPRNFVASLDCWWGSERESTVVIFLRRLGTDGTGFDAAHETQFARMHPKGIPLGHGSRASRRDGQYREICVQQLMNAGIMALGLPAYDGLGKHICIQSPGRPFSVHPATCWEPQTATFTASHDYAGALGAICVPSHDCIYVVYFGRNTNSDFWVRAESKPLETDVNDDDIWLLTQMAENDDMRSEVCYDRGRSLKEKLVAEVKRTALYNVSIWEISIIMKGSSLNEANVKEDEELQRIGMVPADSESAWETSLSEEEKDQELERSPGH